MAAKSAPPPGTSGPAVVMVTGTSDGIDVSAGSSVVTPIPVLEPPSTPVGERVPVVECPQPPDLLPAVEVATALPSSPLSRRSSSASSQTLAWGDVDDSSAPLSPNHVQGGTLAGCSGRGQSF